MRFGPFRGWFRSENRLYADLGPRGLQIAVRLKQALQAQLFLLRFIFLMMRLRAELALLQPPVERQLAIAKETACVVGPRHYSNSSAVWLSPNTGEMPYRLLSRNGLVLRVRWCYGLELEVLNAPAVIFYSRIDAGVLRHEAH